MDSDFNVDVHFTAEMKIVDRYDYFTVPSMVQTMLLFISRLVDKLEALMAERRKLNQELIDLSDKKGFL